MNEPRGNWYLLTGLVLGLAFGLLYSWVISPVKYVDTEPVSLSATYKDEYRRVIALAYASTHDMGRARERLKLLDSGDPLALLVDQAQRMMAENPQSPEARALALLAADIGMPAGVVERPTTTPSVEAEQTIVSGATPQQGSKSPTSTQEAIAVVRTPTAPRPTGTPTITLTPVPSFTPRPTATTVQVTESLYSLISDKEVCAGNVQPGTLQIEVLDADNQPKPGVKITVTWQDGEDVFYTGLALEISPGYADFQMDSGIAYSVRAGEISEEISNISIPSCNGGRKLTFRETKS